MWVLTYNKLWHKKQGPLKPSCQLQVIAVQLGVWLAFDMCI